MNDCVHRYFRHGGLFLCVECGLSKRSFSREETVINKTCDEARGILKIFIEDLDFDEDIDEDDILKVYRTYVAKKVVRKGKVFRVPAKPFSLCAALLWRELRLRKTTMTMSRFSGKIGVDRSTVCNLFRKLDDFKSFGVVRKGRPRKNPPEIEKSVYTIPQDYRI